MNSTKFIRSSIEASNIKGKIMPLILKSIGFYKIVRHVWKLFRENLQFEKKKKLKWQ